MEKPIYHQSTLNQFEYCGWNYYLSVIEQKPRIGSVFTARGSGCHTARKVNLRQKIRSKKNLLLSDCQDAARDYVAKEISDDKIDLKTGELILLSKKRAKANLVDTTVKLVTADYDGLHSKIMPVEVEISKDIELKNWPFNLSGTLDCVDAKSGINDLKITKMVWSQDKADEAYQPAVYSLLYKVHAGKNASSFGYHIVQYSSRTYRTKTYPVITVITDERILSVLRRFNAMHEAIKAGIFPPANSGTWKCSPTWCEQYHNCKYVRK